MSDAALIGVDWGTSNFRAFLLDAVGRDPRPALRPARHHDGVGRRLRADARRTASATGSSEGRLPILMSGMIGSRQGWVEAPYVATPLGIGDLAAALARVPFDAAEVRIVAGLKTADDDDARRHPRRGDAGFRRARRGSASTSGRFLLPGTHSKWVTSKAAGSPPSPPT